MKKIQFSPFSLTAAFLVVLGLVLFTLLFKPYPWDEKPDSVQDGKKLYAQLRCGYCHQLNGKGGVAGPALDNVGFRRTQEWLARHFQDPKKISPGSAMPRLNLTKEEVASLTDYMNSLGGVTFTAQAPVLYQKYCASCHSFRGLGPEARMNLSREALFRDRDFIRDYIKDPSALNVKAGMRGFRGRLTDAQIDDLANYIVQTFR